MEFIKECSIHDFNFWGGAVDTIKELTLDELDILEELITDVFYDVSETTETCINDFVWFERDLIAQHLGYNDFDELMEGR